jgi:hypothetical protein
LGQGAEGRGEGSVADLGRQRALGREVVLEATEGQVTQRLIAHVTRPAFRRRGTFTLFTSAGHRDGRAERAAHGVGDAAYHGKSLLVPRTMWTTRLPTNARPRLSGTAAPSRSFSPRCPASGTGFGNAVGRCVLVREQGSTKSYELALFTLDTTAAAGVVKRYAVRCSIEPSNATSKQQTDVGQARNRVPRAVERTVPFGMLVQTLVIVWYALHGHHDDVLAQRLAEPWYDSKTEPSFEDMIAKLRRTLITARFTIVPPGQVDPELLRDYSLACAAAAT